MGTNTRLFSGTNYVPPFFGGGAAAPLKVVFPKKGSLFLKDWTSANKSKQSCLVIVTNQQGSKKEAGGMANWSFDLFKKQNVPRQGLRVLQREVNLHKEVLGKLGGSLALYPHFVETEAWLLPYLLQGESRQTQSSLAKERGCLNQNGGRAITFWKMMFATNCQTV